MIVGVAGILPLSCPVGADGAAAGGLGERSERRLRGPGGRERERLSWQILELDEATIDVSLTTGMSPTTSLSMKLAVTPPTH